MKFSGFASHRVGSVKRAGRIDKKAGAINIAVLILAMDLHDGVAAALEDILDFLADGIADRRRGWPAEVGTGCQAEPAKRAKAGCERRNRAQIADLR